MSLKIFTSESVSKGHPDKLCDVIADSIKDAILWADKHARVAVEVAVTTDFCLLMGEVTSKAKVNYENIARQAIKSVGYRDGNVVGFDANTVEIKNLIHSQSPDIAMGVSEENCGAGDQGIIFGYACDETAEKIPFTWLLARELTEKAYQLAEKTNFRDFFPDIKSQVTACYNEDGTIAYIDTVVVAASHSENLSEEFVRSTIIENVITPVVKSHGYEVNKIHEIHVNSTGRFVACGPAADSGLTGRKLVVDQYGGHSAVGGGTMQGKDPTKVDNSAALMARYIAKNIVASNLAKKCQVQLSYAIGVAAPVSINIECFGTETINVASIEYTVRQIVDCSPMGIIERFSLRAPKGWDYAEASGSGWFGNSKYPWEALDLVEKLEVLKG